MRARMLALLAAAVLLIPTTAIAVAADPGSGVDAQVFGAAYAPVPGTPGGTLVVGETQYPSNLNPYYGMSVSDSEATRPILRGCATMTGDGKSVPDLCASLPSESNGGIVVSGTTFTMTLHLKPGLTWSDGHALTLNDLRYTWQWVNDPAQKDCWSCGWMWSAIDAIDVSSDGLTATVHFSRPDGDWLAWLTSAILPQHYMSTIPVADAKQDSYPIGEAVTKAPVSGPFTITGVTETEIEYARNPTFAGGVSAAHVGPAYLEHLKFVYFGDADSEIAAFKAGTIDLALGLQPSAYSSLKDTPATTGAIVEAPTAQVEHLSVNNDPTHARRNGLWDVRVRKAIATAIDKKAIVAGLFPGESVQVACGPIPPGTWFAKPVVCPGFSRKAAQALLTKAGWKVDKRGWVADRSGREMNLRLCTTANNPTRLATLKKVQADLKAIHVKSTIVTVSPSDFFKGWDAAAATMPCNLKRGSFDLALFTYGLGASASGAFSLFDSSKWPEGGTHDGGNYPRFKSAAMDAAVKALQTDVTLASQIADAGKAQDAYAAGFPWVALYYRPTLVAVGVHVGNWPGIAQGGGDLWNVGDWFYKP